MRGRDPDTDEFLAPSRSAQRRAALDVLELGEQLAEMTAAQLGRLPVPEAVMAQIRETQRITSHGARKRQLAFLAKHMRKLDDEELEAIRDAMAKDGEAARRETAALHRIEALRDALLDAHPGADRQHLRQLVRNAHEERKRNKPPRAFRELFRELRQLVAPDAAGDGPDGRDGDERDHG